MECSVGNYISEECHKSVYGDVNRVVKQIDEFSVDDKLLLQLRISDNINNICKYHDIQFLEKYHHPYGRICSDPINYHKSLSKRV